MTTITDSRLKEHFAAKAAGDSGFAIAHALLILAQAQQATATHLKYLGVGNAATTMGAVEYLAQQLQEGLNDAAEAIRCLAEPMRSDHPLQGQTFERLEGALDNIASAIEGAANTINENRNNDGIS
jgi:hypothetical protein